MEPYDQFTEFDPFFRAVCYENIRPIIPANTLPSLADLISTCWHSDPKKRPTCAQIVHSLQHIMIEEAVTDEEGRQLWKDNCLDRQSIYWDDFIDIFEEPFVYLPDQASLKELGAAQEFQLSEYSSRDLEKAAAVSNEWIRRTGMPTAPDNIAELEAAYEVKVKCLKSLLVSKGPGDLDMVELEKFGDVLKWFGPIRDPDGSVNIIERVCGDFHQSIILPVPVDR
jgi:hypothetical protein